MGDQGRVLVSILVLSLWVYPFDVGGQPKFEAQVHYSVTTGDLGEVSGGGIGNVLVGLVVPMSKSGNINAVVKIGYNDYGGLEGTGFLSGLEFKVRGYPFVGGVRAYDSMKRLFFEGGLGVEVKQGHLSFGADSEDESEAAFLVSVGAGVFFWRGLGVAGSYNISQNSWQYGNIGLVYRFGG